MSKCGEYHYECDSCQECFELYDIAYLGALKLGDTSCTPFTAMISICRHCITKKEYKKYAKNKKS